MEKKSEISLNKKSIEELRRIYDGICDLYKQIRLRVLTYLGAGFALFSYLYISGDNENKTIAEKLFVPPEPYGVILYVLAFSACIMAFVLLIYGMQTVTWRYPTDIEEHEKLESYEELEFLKYLRKEYIGALNIDIGHCEKKQKLATVASYLLMFGGILLVIIKNF
jgi:hypothetical protein